MKGRNRGSRLPTSGVGGTVEDHVSDPLTDRSTPGGAALPPEPRVDIVVACRNAASFLPGVIRSVLDQDYPAVRLFVQDGASTDDTAGVLRQYPVDWASEPDRGISEALNRAIRATSAPIVGFTCADDRLAPGAVRAAAEAFTRGPRTMMAYGDCEMMDRGGSVYRRWISRPFDLDTLFWDNYIPFQTVYVRREALQAVGGFDETLPLVQDWDLWLRLGAAYASDQFAYIARAQGFYRFYQQSTGCRDLAAAAECRRRAATRFLSDARAVARLRLGPRHAESAARLQIAHLLFLAGQSRAAWRLAVTSVLACPGQFRHLKTFSVFAQLAVGQRIARPVRRLANARLQPDRVPESPRV